MPELGSKCANVGSSEGGLCSIGPRGTSSMSASLSSRVGASIARSASGTGGFADSVKPEERDSSGVTEVVLLKLASFETRADAAGFAGAT